MVRRGATMAALVAVMVTTIGSGAAGCADGSSRSSITSRPSDDGIVFTDPRDRYQLVVDPHWIYDDDAGGGLADIWFVTRAPVDDFGANVNVIVQDVGSIDLDSYMSASRDTLGEFIEAATVRSETRVAAADGDLLGRIEYTGQAEGRSLAFLQYVDVDDGTAVVATLTARPEDFDDLARAVEPFLATVAAR